MLAALRLPIKSLPPMFTIFCELPDIPFITLKSSSSLSLCLTARPPVFVVSSDVLLAILIYSTESTISRAASTVSYTHLTLPTKRIV